MSVVKEFKSPDNKESALEVVDSFRRAIEDGQIVAFAAVGIEPDDCTRMWCGSVKKTTRLKMTGAISAMLWHYQTDTE